MNDDRQAFDRALAQHSNPSTEQVESAVARVWKALPAENANGRGLVQSDERPTRKSRWLIPVAVTALLLVGIGSIALMRNVETSELSAGKAGEIVRAESGKELVLSDGSRVEMRAGTELAKELASDGIRLRLNRGSIIVFAAKQGAGHLYVETKDLAVSVVGTVFFVSAEEKGSRVAVFEGEVSVRYGEREGSLSPGEQLATNPAMPAINLAEEIPWSRRATKLLAMLSRGERPAAAVPSPQPLPTFQTSKVVKDGGFEVAAVRIEDRPPNGASPASLQGVACTGRDGTWRALVSERLTPFVAPRGHCLTRYTNVQMLLASLYDIPWQRVIGNVPNWRVPGSPYEAGFQIDAKADDLVGVSIDQLRKMLTDLLMQRFQMKFHSEMRELAGAELKLAAGASKLREVPASETTSPTLDQSTRDWVIKGKTSMKTLADFISKVQPLRCVVVDRTGLDGIYDYTLTLRLSPAIDLNGSEMAIEDAKKKGAARTTSTAPCDSLFNANGGTIIYEFSPTFSKSLQQQLGLSMQPARVSVEHIIVDEVSPPSEN